MRTVLLAVLLAAAFEARSIRLKRAIVDSAAVRVNPAATDAVAIESSDVATYQSMLEQILRELSALGESKHTGGPQTPEDLAAEYQRAYYTQAASEVVGKLIQYGALSAIVDAENAAFSEDSDSESEASKQEEEEEEEEKLAPAIASAAAAAPAAESEQEEQFTDEQAREVLRMIVDQLMGKFFEDIKRSQMVVLGAASKSSSSSSSSSSESEEEEEDSGEAGAASNEEEEEGDEEAYYYETGDDEDEEPFSHYILEADDDAVIVVNKKVSTNLIRIPSSVFVETIAKLMPSFKKEATPQLTPLQIEDARVYAGNGNPLISSVPSAKPGSGSGSGSGSGAGSGSGTTDFVHPPPLLIVPIHTVSPISPASGAAASSEEHHRFHHGLDLGHVLLCIAAALLILWALVQLRALWRGRRGPAAVAPAPPTPPKVIPAMIPNIYATPAPILTAPLRPAQTAAADADKPPVYVENATTNAAKVEA